MRMSAMPEVVSSLMVTPSSFSTMPNQASFCAFWKAPPQDEMVSVFCCAKAAEAPMATTALISAVAPSSGIRIYYPSRLAR